MALPVPIQGAGVNVCNTSDHFHVCENSLLPADERFEEWYQSVSLFVAIAAIAIPVVLLVTRHGWRAWKQARNKTTAAPLLSCPGREVSSPEPPDILKLAKSFHLCAPGQRCDAECDIHILSHQSDGSGRQSPPAVLPPATGSLFHLIDGDHFAGESAVAGFFARIGGDGVILRISDTTRESTVTAVLSRAGTLGTPIVVMADHDCQLLDLINFRSVDGIIIESACILPDGDRRDYFRSGRLRQIMMRCAGRREESGSFFVGFLDVWDKQPSPAVVRRGFKLAEHFGAVLNHGPSNEAYAQGVAITELPMSLSAFEFLRRGEISELQKSWFNSLRQTYVPKGDGMIPMVASLPLSELSNILQNADALLEAFSLPEDLAYLRAKTTSRILPPDYTSTAPIRRNFWEFSNENEPLSPFGSFPVCVTASEEQYHAIVESQEHLKELKMLQELKQSETHEMATKFEQIADSRYGALVDALVDGLKTKQIRVYKGLHSGFTLPGGASYFWGVSSCPNESAPTFVDIYVSQKSPHDAAVVLHTWLAHNHVARLHRFEEELGFEYAMTPDCNESLPPTTREELDTATISELLLLVQQLRLSGTTHKFKHAIESRCSKLLLAQTTSQAWKETSAKQYLRGEIDIPGLLKMRLGMLAKAGATELPTLGNLVHLFTLIDTLVRGALFSGNRDPLIKISESLLRAYDPWQSWTHCDYVDINAELVALMFFCTLRKAALEEVYIEATDRCPYYLSQPDQAAVFSELWVLGSQCEGYFGIFPRDVGAIIFDRYKQFLTANPPAEDFKEKPGDWSAYPVIEASDGEENLTGDDAEVKHKISWPRIASKIKTKVRELGGMSIFCLPAIMDVVLLSFSGRGLFMTAFMDPQHLQVAVYALLLSLLLTAGVTGWVGSIGNYYLCHYAYDNMAYFHVQRLSGGFVLTLIVAAVGFAITAVQYSPLVGLVFVAYIILIATYMNLLGIMATMHQTGSPLTSGRIALWRALPVLFISPIVSSFVNGNDLAIYLPVAYGFLVFTLIQYRNLCHEWSMWMTHIPKITENEILDWYSDKAEQFARDDKSSSAGDDQAKVRSRMAREAFTKAIEEYNGRFIKSWGKKDPLVERTAKGLPYAAWLLRKDDGPIPDPFTTAWFPQLKTAIDRHKQLVRGLKEHSIFILFRLAKNDIGVNLALFLIALMDRWVNIVMNIREPIPSMYFDMRARYGICLGLIYFCVAVMALDATLEGYWKDMFELSETKLSDLEQARLEEKKWEARRHKRIFSAIYKLAQRLVLLFGSTTVFLWLLVGDYRSFILYYLYILGYTCVIVFQFNRCFTTDIDRHLQGLYIGIAAGFVTGCVLHVLPWTHGSLFNDVIAQNVAGLTAVFFTSLWVWKNAQPKLPDKAVRSPQDKQPTVWMQSRLVSTTPDLGDTPEVVLDSVRGSHLMANDGSPLGGIVYDQMQKTVSQPNSIVTRCSWAPDLIQRSLRLWNEGSIDITITTRENFQSSGFEGACSASRIENGVLRIVVGYFDDESISSAAWQPILAELIVEAIFYHTARAVMGLSEAKAVHAEHFLRDPSLTVSRRLDLELAMADPGYLVTLMHQSNADLMKQLCLDVEVDRDWTKLPESARAAILRRITGHPIPATQDFMDWVEDAFVDVQTCDFRVNLALDIYDKCIERYDPSVNYTGANPTRLTGAMELLDGTLTVPKLTMGARLRSLGRNIKDMPISVVKWVAIITGAGADIERELWFLLEGTAFRTFLLMIILIIWKICWLIKNAWVYVILIYHRPALVNISRLAQKGASRRLHKSRIVAEFSRKTYTGFATQTELGCLGLDIYDGSFTEKPAKGDPVATAVYDENLRLISRTDKDTVTTYQYGGGRSGRSRWPTSKEETTGSTSKATYNYDKYGRVSHGTMQIKEIEVEFNYHYKASPKGNSDIVKGDFKFAGSSRDSLTVFWGVPLRQDTANDEKNGKYHWVSSERVCKIIRIIAGHTYVTEVEYTHRRDPTYSTYVEEGDGQVRHVAEAPKIFPEEDLLLRRPNNLSFDSDDLLIFHGRNKIRKLASYVSGSSRSFISFLNPLGWFESKIVYTKVTTWRSRTALWNHWLKTGVLDAATACWVDELILREEPLLRQYWRYRDTGRLQDAKRVLDNQVHQIVSAIEIETDVAEVCLLPIKISDLYTMGLGKDATQVTYRPEDCYNDTRERISVIFNDVGCWPEAPGGVSNCRRDLVNGHSTIRNHVLAESANDFGIPRFQIERNVNSLKLLPLWGLDARTAQHGLLDNLLQSQVDEKILDTDISHDVEGIFIPLLKTFVKGARAKSYTRDDLLQYSNAVLSMAKYFETRDYNKTWNSHAVKRAWMEAWLCTYADDNIRNPREYFHLEHPSMSDFRDALAIYSSYLFIFSVQMPEEGGCPRVFQSSHHGLSSLFGMVLKYRKGVAFGIWDHAILWRECCLNISPAQCALPIPVQAMLLAGMGLAARLSYFHADVIVPCTSLFNPVWEMEIGADQGRIMPKTQFQRKIDPIVNGISNMEKFQPVAKIRSEIPTVVMLSNIQFIKDIKTSILAANVIVNVYGFKEYKLLIYGAQDRQPSYFLEMTKLIAESGLKDHVSLAGFGSPSEVLKDAWLFMNSSISEGLPLAIGEAALAGVPIVATEVGATALVMTNPDDRTERYGEVVPPNDPVALARAQLSVLSMTGQWARFTPESKNPPTLPDDITLEDVKWLTKRMYERAEDRRKLGMLSRQVVLRSFHGERYLREHEQMYWIQWHMSRMRADAEVNAAEVAGTRYGAMPVIRFRERPDDGYETDGTDTGSLTSKRTTQSRHSRRWQDFQADDGYRRLSKLRPSGTFTRPSSRGSDTPTYMHSRNASRVDIRDHTRDHSRNHSRSASRGRTHSRSRNASVSASIPGNPSRGSLPSITRVNSYISFTDMV